MKVLIDMNLSPQWRQPQTTLALVVVEPADFRVRILPI